ncbi:hypothetical protein AB0M02_32880 [Actinoplanes sp. NPDC051861]|uniref:hypothetical protein n=1 Tax=Actinoplanes sp. NPDC051861 TaxID=3155170 RepID=UPI00342F147F
MPIHVEDMTSDITVVDGDLPLSPRQLEAITAHVAARLQQRQRDAEHSREAVRIRRSVLPPLETRG